MKRDFQDSDFTPYLNKMFTIHLGDEETVDSTLIEVRRLGSDDVDHAGRAPFSLTFRCPKARLFPQRIYRVDHEEMGSLEIFLVPIGPDETGMRYEAVFA
jgi:hypothetical protein